MKVIFLMLFIVGCVTTTQTVDINDMEPGCYYSETNGYSEFSFRTQDEIHTLWNLGVIEGKIWHPVDCEEMKIVENVN